MAVPGVTPDYKQALTPKETPTMPTTRNIERRQVVGSGGRPRTVTVCEFGCWHSSYAQAVKCSNALAILKPAES